MSAFLKKGSVRLDCLLQCAEPLISSDFDGFSLLLNGCVYEGFRGNNPT